ncbi:MAG: c-type cytochrome [Chloroflexi bacterium]|nr:c-type cytochrome [Chloroflexota bacterium]
MNVLKWPVLLFCPVVLWLLAGPLCAQTPEWIWHDNKGIAPQDNEVRCFRKSFQVDGPVAKALLMAAGDNAATVYLNGKQVAANRDWNKPARVDVTKQIRAGENLLAIRGRNESSAAAILVKLELALPNNQKQLIVSDTSWISSAVETDHWFRPGFAAAGWTKPVSLGKLGVHPWGDVMAPPAATPAETLALLPGFKVELLRSAEAGEGSWVSMAIDPKGRLIISPQEGTGNILRVTLDPAGRLEKLEKIDLPVGSAMGLLYAFESLYVSGAGPKGLALYRLRDTNGDDRYDEVQFLRKFDGAGGEHGSHGLVLGPDKMLYYVHGNFVKLPADLSTDSPHRHYAEDQLLPRGEDGNGFGVGIKPPGGFVVRMDPEAKRCELFAAGFRNAYDIGFNSDGELFTFDSDMEWDWGMPWYRPIRINHVVSGGDYGFREGTGKWPAHYPDSLPATVDIGVGSPTGVKFGTGSAFPPKYQKAFFVMDWSYGRIIAVHLTPKGSTYSGTAETFVKGKPLNVTDLEFGRDGAMYFTTGGRGTQSGLYRVTYVGPRPSNPPPAAELPAENEAAQARALRHKLEPFHGKKDPAALDFAWPHLNSDDRWIRYAARIAVESQPVELWQRRALEEGRSNAALTALLALARLGQPGLQPDLLEALSRLSPEALSETQKLEALRVLSLAFIRMGRPEAEIARQVVAALEPLYPAQNEKLNRELSQLMIYLEAPGVVAKTLALFEAALTQEEQIHYLFHLRTLKSGWTMEQRARYFNWFNRSREGLQHPAEVIKWFLDAGREYNDGASFPKFIAYFRKDALATLTEQERAELAPMITEQTPAARSVAQRGFVKDWKVEDLLADLDQVGKGRSFQKGKEAFAAAQCVTCHRFGNEGGSVGPELTAISSRFTRRDILESILEPSKVISEQFQNMNLYLKNGDDVTGRIVEETEQKVVLVTNALTNDRTEVKKADIEKRVVSQVSAMPEGLAYVLAKEEILDLLAYLESSGKADTAAFGK